MANDDPTMQEAEANEFLRTVRRYFHQSFDDGELTRDRWEIADDRSLEAEFVPSKRAMKSWRLKAQIWIAKPQKLTGKYRCAFELVYLHPNEPTRKEILKRESIAEVVRCFLRDRKIPNDQRLSKGSTCTRLPLQVAPLSATDATAYTLLCKSEAKRVISFAKFLDSALGTWTEIGPEVHDGAELSAKEILEAAKSFRGMGESDAHKSLKNFVADHPELIGLVGAKPGRMECPLASGDKLDISFDSEAFWVAVEIKSSISLEGDIVRGLFQCVKYAAVMNAELAYRSRPQNARALLCLGGKLPMALLSLKEKLQVDVFDNIDAKLPRTTSHYCQHTSGVTESADVPI